LVATGKVSGQRQRLVFHAFGGRRHPLGGGAGLIDASRQTLK
jgi:hypothetical protein